MTRFKSELLNVLQERSFVHQITDPEGLDAKAAEGRVTGYIGFDATADSLHIGNLVGIMMLHWMQKLGHRPIALMGGGTTKIGDPSGKDTSRQLLSAEQIDANIAAIKRNFSGYLNFGDGPNDALMVNNADWLDGLGYIPFLRDVGMHFTINRMLTFESVKIRLDREQPLTFLEFNYMILQAYDFLELNRRYSCDLQLGGSDQWGNIVNGIELGRRIDGASLYGFTSPLITTSSGAKMGKSADGAVWLSAEKLSPYDYWQFWRNTEDADVGRFLGLYTELPMDEVRRLEALDGAEINEAKKILATEATALCHGRQAANEAAQTAQRTFEHGESAKGLPTTEVAHAEMAAGLPAFRVFVLTGLANSNGEARRLIAGGGGRVNDVKIADAEDQIGPAMANDDGTIKLSAGKKRHALLKVV
ncbi:MAG: tyrosine--tRNA ligase [Pseudomonadota bacterium]